MLGQLILGKYKVVRQIDEGGMSKIYLAQQVAPAREVVVKVLKEPLRLQTKPVEHFRREIYIMSRFRHANTVAVHDSTTRDAHGPILVMEYLRGCDLNTLIQREHRFTPERVGRLLGPLCDVLQAAHEAGIVHRDIKPGNLMVLHPNTPQETVKLMDYGLAKMNAMFYISPDDLVDFSLPAASGTPEYISPEMVRGNDLDGRGDLYSVGVVLYELLTGRGPFQHSRIETLMLAHADEPVPSFAEIGAPDLVPPAVEAVVMSCLAKYPDERPKSALELAQAYERALGRRIVPPRAGTAPAPGPSTSSGMRPSATAVLPKKAEQSAVTHSIEASMPESMAMIKLKGFVFDLGGEVVESVPGMIKVRLQGVAAKTTSGLFRLLGKSPPAAPTVPATDLELHMERRDPGKASQLTITLVMLPQGGQPTVAWRDRCNQISRDLQAYMMGR